MPLDSLELRASLQRVLGALILILVPLTVFGFYVALQGDSQIRQMAGENIRSITRTAAEFTSEFIGEIVKNVSVIANNPSLVQAVISANHQYEHLSEDAIGSKLGAIELKWNSSESDALARNILTSDLARQLRRMRELNPSLLKVTVADTVGATVAGTDKPIALLSDGSRVLGGVVFPRTGCNRRGRSALRRTEPAVLPQHRLPHPAGKNRQVHRRGHRSGRCLAPVCSTEPAADRQHRATVSGA